MTRRVAAALSAAVALTAGALTLAVGATVGLFGTDRTSPTGRLNPVADAPDVRERPRVETVYVDVTAPPVAPRKTAPAAPARPAQVRPAQPVETVVVYDPPATTQQTVSHTEVEHETEAEPADGADD